MEIKSQSTKEVRFTLSESQVLLKAINELNFTGSQQVAEFEDEKGKKFIVILECQNNNEDIEEDYTCNEDVEEYSTYDEDTEEETIEASQVK